MRFQNLQNGAELVTIFVGRIRLYSFLKSSRKSSRYKLTL